MDANAWGAQWKNARNAKQTAKNAMENHPVPSYNIWKTNGQRCRYGDKRKTIWPGLGGLLDANGSSCAAAHRILTGRRCSDGFDQLARMGKWELSLEALALKPQWGELFSDEEANEALHRLMEAGCRFL